MCTTVPSLFAVISLFGPKKVIDRCVVEQQLDEALHIIKNNGCEAFVSVVRFQMFQL